jgi:hypothetical protein
VIHVAGQDALNRALPIMEEGEDRQSRRIVVASGKCGKLFQGLVFCPDTDNKCPLMGTVPSSNDLSAVLNQTGSDLHSERAAPLAIEWLVRFVSQKM